MAEFSVVVDGNLHSIELVNDIPYEDLDVILKFINDDRYFIEKKNEFKDFKFIGKGSYGMVYGYKGYAIKHMSVREFTEDSTECNDVAVLKDLGHLDCIPSLYAVINSNVMIVERIKGLTVRELCIEGLTNGNIIMDETFVSKWDESLLEVIENGYSPRDLHESNIMIEEHTNKPKFVDVGWFIKHGCTYDSKDSMMSNEGYQRAYDYSSYTIKGYIDKHKSSMKQAV